MVSRLRDAGEKSTLEDTVDGMSVVYGRTSARGIAALRGVDALAIDRLRRPTPQAAERLSIRAVEKGTRYWRPTSTVTSSVVVKKPSNAQACRT